MTSVPDLISLARRIDTFADDAEARGNESRAAELRELATALRATLAKQVTTRRAVAGRRVNNAEGSSQRPRTSPSPAV